MDKPKVTPKDFFLWAGAMVALYWSVVAFIFLIFNYIDYAFPNALSYLPDPYASGMPYEMASIVVLFPIYLVLMWLIRRDIARDATRKDIWVRRWALIFTLFVAGITVAVDIITLLTSFFRGEELTTAFLLKVLVVFLVAAMAFMHFIADFWGYWEQYPNRRRYVGIGALVVAVVAVFSGFLIVGTPGHARLMRLDDQKVNDLTNIQYHITDYYRQKQRLPAALTDLNNALANFTVPADPQSGAAYEYRVTKAPYSFELCATFNAEGSSQYDRYPTAPVLGPTDEPGNQGNWQHGAGRQCFERTVDPELYPPATK